MSLKRMLENHSNGSARTLLKGSDVPAGTRTITIEVAGVRESPPGFRAPAIIDLKKTLYGKSAWTVNKTNQNLLIQLFGDDEEKLIGKKIKLDVISVRNPETGETVPGLAVSGRQ